MNPKVNPETIVRNVYPVPEKPVYVPGTEIEIVTPDIERGRIRYAVFDFDGTVSILREGWQNIMAPVMIDAIRGDHPVTPKIEEAVREYIDESTGIQTILQMERLVEMVHEFGLVPKEKILDAWGYKAIYNDALMVPVRKRIAELQSGKKTLEQATLRGARDFLRKLYERGITIYLASGTDRDDVRNESHAVQVDQWCKGGIFGALRSIEEYSKDKVIKEILRDYDLHGSELFIAGDGPVEIRNAKDNGALAIGVASDEVRGHGLNAEKRRRLIRAGADILIPDFGEHDKLLRYLFNE